MALLVSDLVWPEEGDPTARIARHLRIGARAVLGFAIVKRSLDARQRSAVWRVVLRVEVADEEGVLRRRISSVRRWSERDSGRYGLDDGMATPGRPAVPSDRRPVVVGMGPAGMFSALYLAEAGLCPLVLERGAPVEPRVTSVNAWWRGKAELDPEDNLVIGEGGSGTFSDGKIYTRRRDGELGYIFRRLVDFGADPALLQDSLAHLGTDKIRAILPPFRARLTELGAEVRFHARVDRLVVEDGRCTGVVLSDGTTEQASAVIMATGHSARDAVEMMLAAGAAAAPRGIAVGVRIEHPQALIDRGRYHRDDRGALPPATYRLAHHPAVGPRGHTFCMCPGGMVVPASNHPGRLVVNGMSFAARRGFWANSAVIVDVPASAYGAPDAMAGFRWQDAIERRAFELGGAGWAAPAQRVVDLLAERPSADLPRTSFPMGLASVDLATLFPPFLTAALKEVIQSFDRQIPGFAGPDALLIAPETRTTSPVVFARTPDQESTTVRGLFPAGEGAGYAGGIVSSALDGLRAARAIAGGPVDNSVDDG